ncbi:glutamate receptor ionotropic, kainate 1 [Teleopsis dalmanni]|uniref:glutamate receptor ionotropic, kainate 1 n=1 Tax=Teleopsis dalmanni TaxID=139649 RepID=UPI0018CF5AA6|nr:glutamate receptor ionotropic, kainate 1 [Teleopsis dalmanni]
MRNTPVIAITIVSFQVLINKTKMTVFNTVLETTNGNDLRVANDSSNLSVSSSMRRVNLFIAYFHFHGVHSVHLVICHDDTKKREIQTILGSLLDEGFYVRTYNGRDYNDEVITARLFEPPITFRSDNKTKRPINFKLESLAFKTGYILIDFATSCALNVLSWSAASEQNYFTTNRFWLLLTERKEDIQLLNDEDIFIPPDAEVRILVQHNNSNHFNLIDVYKSAKEQPIHEHNVGNKLSSAEDMLRALRKFGSAITHRQNLGGITFKTGLVIAFPDMFTHIEDLSLRHIDTISKVNNRLTIELANKLNMSFNTHQTDNYGWHQSDNSFDGLMGRFQRYELDFAQNAIFMRLDRIALVDFVAETFRIRAGIMFRQPPLSAVKNIFALPFEIDVWISIFMLMVFVAFVLAMELMFSPYVHDMDYGDCVVFVWGAMCQQSFYVNLGNRSARVIIFTTFVATVFLFTSFSANIVALLQSPSEAIHTLSDLSQSPLEIGVQDTVYNKIYFNESTDPITNRLYHKKIAPKGENIYMRPLIGMEKMRTGLFAYQVELQAGYQIISDTFSEPEKCGLKELEPFQLPMIAIPTRKNFPYKELFRRQLRWQREVGLMNREELKWFPQKPKCEGGVGGFVSIGITECRYALGMFGFGFFLGLFVFFFEVIFKRNIVICLTNRSDHRNREHTFNMIYTCDNDIRAIVVMNKK